LQKRMQYGDGHRQVQRHDLLIRVQYCAVGLQRSDRTGRRRLRMRDAHVLRNELPDDSHEWSRSELLRLRRERDVQRDRGTRGVRRVRWRVGVHVDPIDGLLPVRTRQFGVRSVWRPMLLLAILGSLQRHGSSRDDGELQTFVRRQLGPSLELKSRRHASSRAERDSTSDTRKGCWSNPCSRSRCKSPCTPSKRTREAYSRTRASGSRRPRS
jgi:hypothetical protein